MSTDNTKELLLHIGDRVCYAPHCRECIGLITRRTKRGYHYQFSLCGKHAPKPYKPSRREYFIALDETHYLTVLDDEFVRWVREVRDGAS